MTDETSDQAFDDDLEAAFGQRPDGAIEGDPDGDLDGAADTDLLADAEQAMAEARARLADVPAEVVVTNHVMGLYELAAIHLSTDPPDLVQSALAIDAVGCLVDGLGDRLGPDTPTMRDALNNIRMAFVQIKAQAGASDAASG